RLEDLVVVAPERDAAIVDVGDGRGLGVAHQYAVRELVDSEPAVDERRPARRVDHDLVAAVEERLDELPGALAWLEQLVLALPAGVGVQHAIEVEADGLHRPSMAMPLLAKNMASSSFVSARLR